MIRSVCVLGLVTSLALAGPVMAQEDASVTPDMAAADSENYRAVDPENYIIFRTSTGVIHIEMLPEVAPAHVAQFRAIIRSGDFDGTAFHRVIDGFMAQGGDIFALKGRESGLPDIPGEFTFRRDADARPISPIGDGETAVDGFLDGMPLKTQAAWIGDMSRDGLVESYIPHCRGVVSTARTSNPDSANSQFFLMLDRAEYLDRQYTAWGRILEGFDALDSITKGEPPANPDVLISAKLASDIPEAERPSAWVQRTDGPGFTDALAAAAAGSGDVCDEAPVPAIIALP